MTSHACTNSLYGAVQVTPWWVYVSERPHIFGPPQIKKYRQTQTPPHLRLLITQVWSLLDLNDAVWIATVKSAGQVGGLYVHGMPGLVMIGLEDTLAIASRFWQDRLIPVTPAVGDLLCAQGYVVVSWEELVRQVRERILVHELGHALRSQFGIETPYDHEELAADYLAGWIDALLGKEANLGVLIFHHIGCTERVCSHPIPEARALAYARGHRDTQPYLNPFTRSRSRPCPSTF